MTSSTEEVAKTAADRFRKDNGLGVQPLGDLVALIEHSTGCDVAVLDVASDEHGLTMRDPVRDRVFIGVARTSNPMRQRSTLAHELAHIVFDDDVEEFGVRSPLETRADAFARHLLIPIEGLQGFVGNREAGEVVLSEVVQRYAVSPAIAAIAMREAGLVSTDTASAWMKLTTPYLATKYGWVDAYTAMQDESNRLRAPQRLLSRAIAGYLAGVVSAQAIATLRGVPEDVVLSELSSVGIVPPDMDPGEFELEDLPDVEVDLSVLDGADPTC